MLHIDHISGHVNLVALVKCCQSVNGQLFYLVQDDECGLLLGSSFGDEKKRLIYSQLLGGSFPLLLSLCHARAVKVIVLVYDDAPPLLV